MAGWDRRKLPNWMCKLCGHEAESHFQRCRQAVYRKKQVRRCMLSRDHIGACAYRDLVEPAKHLVQ